MKKIQLLLFVSIFFFACNNEKTAKKDEPSENADEKVEIQECEYILDFENFDFEWTAFKTTEKIAVAGTFDSIRINSLAKSNDFSKLLESVEFNIDTKTINSGNEARDKKLKEYFFSKLLNEGNIKGIISRVDFAEAGKSGEINFIVSMNNIENEIACSFYYKDGMLNISGNTDLLAWKAGSAIESLNAVCKDKHTGKDGITKTWSTIDFTIFIPVAKNCK